MNDIFNEIRRLVEDTYRKPFIDSTFREERHFVTTLYWLMLNPLSGSAFPCAIHNAVFTTLARLEYRNYGKERKKKS